MDRIGMDGIFPSIKRQTGDHECRIASIKDQNEGQYLFSEHGLSKRLYIATKIAGSLILSYKDELSGNNGFPVPEFLARQSYLIADELLKQEKDV